MFFWEIYKIFRTGFTRNTSECRLLQLIVTGKCFDQKMFFKKYLIRLDILWHVLPRITYSRPLKTFQDVYLGLYLICLVHFFSCFIHLDKRQSHEHCLDYTQLFFLCRKLQEASGRLVALGSLGVNVCETLGRKNNCKLNVFSMYLVRNNEEIHLSFKNSEK